MFGSGASGSTFGFEVACGTAFALIFLVVGGGCAVIQRLTPSINLRSTKWFSLGVERVREDGPWLMDRGRESRLEWALVAFLATPEHKLVKRYALIMGDRLRQFARTVHRVRKMFAQGS